MTHLAGAPDVSVIVSAFNRGDELRDTLESLVSQAAGAVRFEVIAVDNNSTDNTADVIQSFTGRSPVPVRYLFEPEQGVSYGRNAGIRVARGRVLAFTDDDIVVAPDWVRAIADRFQQNPEVDYLSGRMLPMFDGAQPAWMGPRNSAPCVLRDRGADPIYSKPGHYFAGWATANIAFRREVFDRVGLFSGDFPRGQDLELIVRVWRANGRGMYAPDVTVSHRIPADRLTKAYHRMWHSREGDIRARVRFREIFDPDGRIIPGEPAITRVFGIPRFLFRRLFVESTRWVAAAVRGQEAQAFALESEVRQMCRYMRTSFRRRRAPTVMQPPGGLTGVQALRRNS